MTDRNENFLCRTSEQSSTRPYKPVYSWTNNNNDIRSNSSANLIGRRDGLSVVRDQTNYHRSNAFQRDQTNSNYRLPKKAPIVGWQNGSPTVFPSTPCSTPDPESVDTIDDLSRSQSAASSTKCSEICQDSGNTEDLSSLADERLLQSTPARTIDRSVESLSPDKDTFLTTSPEIGRSKELSLADEDIEDKIDLLSPGTDCTEDRIPPTPPPLDANYLISPNLTIGPSPTNRSDESRSFKRSEGSVNSRRSPEARPIITPNPGYKDDDTRDSIDSDSELTSTAKDGKRKSKVPDGGWGWAVVLASLIISMIADGVSFSFGLLYIEFLQEFGASKLKTAWIGSLFMAVPLLSGPIMSALVDRYGCRSMTIVGGLISGFGFILSCFSTTIEVMYLTFGVIAGLGLGLCYVTAVVSIAYWFEKKRTLAVGLSACGTGIGTFVYAPMTTYFIEEYGWRGTCLLLAGTFFNMIVCGTVMRDPEWWILEQEKQNGATPKKSITKSECDRSSISPVDEFPGIEELRKMLKSGHTPEYLLQILSTTTEDPQSVDGDIRFRSVVNLPTFVRHNEKKWYSELIDLLKGMMDFSMFLELHFLFLSLSTILLFTWFIVPYFYLAEHLTRNSYTESDAANLLSIIGITNTIGMIGLGWAGDQPWMNVSKTYTWCLVACGVATFLMSTFTPYYNLLMITSAAFGLFFASSFSFTPVILVQLIPLERFTTAYGLSLLCQGIGNLLGPPLAGWLFDITNSWDLSFYMAGSWIVVSGLLVGLIPYTKNRKIWGKGPIEMERERDSLA